MSSYSKKGDLEERDFVAFKESVVIMVSLVTLLWLVKGIEWAAQIELGTIGGIYPRTVKGSIGIITSPLLHSDIYHLLSNSFPLIFLGTGLFFFYRTIAKEVFAWIYLSTGVWVWIGARESYHIGASGVVYGMASFIFFSGIFRKNIRLMALSLVVMFLYGGLLYGVFPGITDANISWESHLFGAISGLLTAFFFRKDKVLHMQEEKVQDDDPISKKADTIPQNSTTTNSDIIFHYSYLPSKKSKEARDNKAKS